MAWPTGGSRGTWVVRVPPGSPVGHGVKIYDSGLIQPNNNISDEYTSFREDF